MGDPRLQAVFAGIAILAATVALLHCAPEPLPVFGQVPAFALVDQDGKPFGSAELRGRVYIANFFFTRCPSICPLLMRSVKRLQDACRDREIQGIRLLSVSVDPEYDTPERLRAYGKEMGVDPARWTLVTGKAEEIRRLGQEGFKVAVGTPEADASGLLDIAHTGKLVLVDGKGEIRGYFGTDEPGLKQIFRAAQSLLREKRD